MKLIDKDALAAEITHKIKVLEAFIKNFDGISDKVEKAKNKIEALGDALLFIENLEVKEVELTWEDVREICTQSVLVEIDLGGLVSDERHYTEVLKRFKAKKGEYENRN